MTISMKSVVSISIFLLVISTSCSMKHDVYIEKTGHGRVSFDISLADYLTDVIDQIIQLIKPDEPIPDEQESFFDLGAIREDFRQREGVELISLETPTKDKLVGEFSFTNINQLLQDIEIGSAESQLIRLEKHGDTTELTMNITREAIEALFHENPSINNPLVENFGPAATEGLTDEEYLDMMEFALGEESRLGIKSSFLELTIHVDGQIIDWKGGHRVNSNTVRFNIPMLPILMLKKPLEYSLRYQ